MVFAKSFFIKNGSIQNFYINSELSEACQRECSNLLKPKDEWIYVGWSLGYNLGESNTQSIIGSIRCEIYPVIPVFIGFKALGFIGMSIFPAFSVDLGVSPFKNKNSRHKGIYGSANLYFTDNNAHYYSILPLGGTIGYQFETFFIESPLLIFDKNNNDEDVVRPIFGLHFGWMF